MIALKLVLQSLAAVGSVLACAGGVAYSVSSSEESASAKHPKNFHLLVSAKKADSAPSEELWIKPIVEQVSQQASEPAKEELIQKNYTCKAFESTKINSECEIYSIAVETGKTAIDFFQLKASLKTKTKVMKAEFATENFFLLKVSSSLLTSWTFDGTKKIDLIVLPSSTEKALKIHATLTILASIAEEKITGKTSLSIAKVTSSIVLNSTDLKQYTCKLKTQTMPCSVSSLEPFANKTLKEITFNALSIPKSQTVQSDVPNTFYHLISWDGTVKHSFSDLQSKEVVFSTFNAESKPIKITLTIEAPIFVLPISENVISKVAIIK